MSLFQRGNPLLSMSALFTNDSSPPPANIFLPINYNAGDTIPGDPYTNYQNSVCNSNSRNSKNIKNNSGCVQYNKLVTSGNDPSLGGKMKCASNIRNAPSTSLTLAEYNALLQNRSTK